MLIKNHVGGRELSLLSWHCSQQGMPIMDANEMSAIGDTLMRVVTPDMSPKQLVKAAKKEHPGASKKDIARAAFFSIIANADQDVGKARNLQAFAIAERTQRSD
ncbi:MULTISPECIES: hypothetical protein [Mesorhizobium]|uniref:hypothetical protein n=1 Tax=Mesorhizobium TaxID=68287 RepID=UPI001FD94A98|nr:MULTISPECIES: hypothetical protein [Mesorhizobium]WJI40515.1 hypothetical protein NL534_09825 [Mesorhizobium opportunistum]